MESLDFVLIALSLVSTGFVGFSLLMQFRYATQLFDMLRYYPILSCVPIVTGFSLIFLWPGITLITSVVVVISAIICVLFLYQSLDWYTDYSSEKFRKLLEDIQKESFVIISFSDYDAGRIDSEKVSIVLRHDVDMSLSRTVKMAEIEKELGVQSTFFFRLHAEKYNFEQATPIIKKLAVEGFEIGLHYETLSIAKGERQIAIELLANEIERLRDIAPVNVVAAHGQKGYKNRDIWESVDKEALRVSSAYDMKYDLYLSDAGGKRLSDKNRKWKYLFDRIYEAKPGQIVQVLIHPDWWY